DDQFAVDDEFTGRQRLQRLVDLRKIAAERLPGLCPEINRVALPVGDTAKAVPLRLELPVSARQSVDQSRFHRLDDRGARRCPVCHRHVPGARTRNRTGPTRFPRVGRRRALYSAGAVPIIEFAALDEAFISTMTRNSSIDSSVASEPRTASSSVLPWSARMMPGNISHTPTVASAKWSVGSRPCAAAGTRW